MISKKAFSVLVIAGVLASSVSTSAFAEGHHGMDRGTAVALGVLGGIVVGSIVASNNNTAPVYSAPVYSAPAPVYSQPQTYYQAPQQVYYQPQPVVQYYQSAPPVVYVNEHRHHGHRHDYRGDGYYYSR
jgi:hypothetical protein